MENAQLIAISSQSVLRRQLDVVANNVANMNTAGFKAQSLRFEEFVMPVAEASSFNGHSDQTVSYVHDAQSVYNMKPGATLDTGDPLNVAINGDGWFTIEAEEGTLYTRNGDFTINDQGELVTQAGNRVLSDGNPIVFGPEDAQIEIAQDGTISTSEGIRGRLRAVRFENPGLLRTAGGNLFDGPDALPTEEVRFIQGALEKSNAEPVAEISKLIDVTRKYESISKVLKQIDELRETAIGRLGRVQA